MPSFFPRHTAEWHLEEPAAFRKLSVSLVEMALLAGVAVRLYRAILLGVVAPTGWLALGAGLAAGLVFVVGMAAAHLGNFPVYRWLWRAPAFGALMGVAESFTSLALTALGREPLGSVRATFRDWPSMAFSTVLTRTVLISLFALVLAGVVQWVRMMLVRREGRGESLAAAHEERLARDGIVGGDVP